MKRVLIIMLLFMAFSFNSKEQNLVPNWSFEDTIQCINGYNQFSGYVSNWEGGASGLCYFTSKCNEWLDSVPINYIGYQYPHTGNAYAGLVTFGSDTAAGDTLTLQKNIRAYIQVKLIDSLKASERYYVTFFVSLADSSWFYCNNIGAYFSDSTLKYAKSFQYVKSYLTPQVANDPIHNPLNNSKYWTKVSGSFIAKGGEKYIILGNFNNDSTSTVGYVGEVSWQYPEPIAFYYVDDVIVSPDSNYADSLFDGVSELKVESEKVKVWPNPSDGVINYELKITNYESVRIEVYNVLGEQIANSQWLSANSSMQINLINQPSGIYMYRITDQQGQLIKADKVMIVH